MSTNEIINSLTPPKSPTTSQREVELAEIKESKEWIPLFTCRGESTRRANLWRNTNCASFAQKKDLTWLLDPSRELLPGLEPVQVYGYIFSLSECNEQQVDHLFLLTKRCYDLLRCPSTRDQRRPNRVNLSNVRKEINLFLYYMKWCFAQRREELDTRSEDILIYVLVQLKELLLFVGRISSLNESIVSEATSGQNSSAYHLFHCCLDIWWTCLEMIYLAKSRGLSGDLQLVRDPNFSGDLLSQAEVVLLSDLVLLSNRRFGRITLVSECDLLHPFPCNCVKELYILMRLFLDKVHSNETPQPFWLRLNQIADGFLSTDKLKDSMPSIHHFSYLPIELLQHQANPGTKGRNSLSFVWLISNLCPIYHYNELGVYSELLKSQSNYPVVLKLITSILKTEDASNRTELSPSVCSTLKLCITCCNLWEPSVELLLPFIDFFMKRINKPQSVSLGIESIQLISKSGLQWTEQLRERLESNDVDTYSQNGLDLLLILCKVSITKLMHVKDTQYVAQWQRLMGRISSKLQPRKLQDLNEIGLYNMFTLFLALSHIAKDHWTDLSNRLCETVRIIAQKSAETPKTGLIFKALFAELYICPRSADSGKLVATISSTFEAVVNTFPVSSMETISAKHCVRVDLVFGYFEEVKLYFSSNKTVSLGSEQFVSQSLGSLLPRCSENELTGVFNFIINLFDSMKMDLENEQEDLTEVITLTTANCFTHLVPFIKDRYTKDSVNGTLISRIAANLVIFTTLLPDYEGTDDFRSLFNHFATAKAAEPSACCLFISSVLVNETALDRLRDIYGDELDNFLIGNWCRLGISLIQPNQFFEAFTRVVALNCQSLETTQDPVTLVSFFRNLLVRYACVSPEEQRVIVADAQKYFKDMISVAESFLKDPKVSSELVSHAYDIIAQLVRFCSRILYTAGKNDCLLAKILASFIIGAQFEKGKQFIVQSSVKRCVPFFLEGLSKCGNKFDNFLERKLKQLLGSQIGMVGYKQRHPVLAAVSPNGKTNAVLWKAVVDVMKEQFLAKNCNPNASTVAAIHFLVQAYETLRVAEITRDIRSLIPQLMDKMLVPDETLRRKIKLLLETILKDIQDDEHIQLNSFLCPLVKQFMVKNLGWELSGRIFKVLDTVIALCPQTAFKEVIGIVKISISEFETLRKGVDNELRKSFRDLVAKYSF